MSEHHIVPLKYYFGVFTALMVFTALTVLVAYYDFGSLNLLVAMTIAIIKATLVILIFMHVWWSSKLTKLVIGAGMFWLAILLLMTLADYAARTGWPTSLGAIPVEQVQGTGAAAHGAAPAHSAAPAVHGSAPAHGDAPAASAPAHDAPAKPAEAPAAHAAESPAAKH